MAGKGTRGRAMPWHGNPIRRPIYICHIHTTIEGCNVTMASHEPIWYYSKRESPYSHNHGIDNQSNTSGESGGEVVNSGRIVSPHVNSVPVQGSKWGREAWDTSWEKAKKEKERQNPMRRKANTVGLYSAFILGAAIVLGAVGGLILSAFLGVIGWLGIVTMLVMYLISPAWDK